MKLSSRLFKIFNEGDFDRFGGKIPGPEPTLPLGTAGDFIDHNAWEVAAKYYATYRSGVVLCWFGGSPVLVLNDADLIDQVLVSRWREFYKASPTDALEPVVTECNAFVLNGDDWRASRHAAPFARTAYPSWLAEQAPAIQRACREAARCYLVEASAGGRVDVRSAIERLTFDAFSVMTVGKPLGNEVYEQFVTVMREGDQRIKGLFSEIPSLNPFFYEARERWTNAFEPFVSEALSGSARPGIDMARRFARTAPVKAEVFGQQLANVFPGGLFSASGTVIGCLKLIAENPGTLEPIRRALSEIGPDAGWAALDGCVELDYALREAMRLYPGAPFYGRNTNPDTETEFAGVSLEGDTAVYITPWVVQRLPSHWGEDADRFRPSRWANGVAEANPVGSKYFFPFGRGPRECMGKSFALAFMKGALAVLLNEVDMNLDTKGYSHGFYFGCLQHNGITGTFQARD